MKMLRTGLAYLAAVLATAALGSVIQTQFNMVALQALGAPVATSERLWATGLDLLRFAPLYAALVAVALLLGFAVAGLLARRWPQRRRGLFMLAGGSAVLTTLVLMNMLLPMTVIAATRFPMAVALLALAGVIGGWLYGRLQG